jgi:hypothetical protein
MGHLHAPKMTAVWTPQKATNTLTFLVWTPWKKILQQLAEPSLGMGHQEALVPMVYGRSWELG